MNELQIYKIITRSEVLNIITALQNMLVLNSELYNKTNDKLFPEPKKIISALKYFETVYKTMQL